MANCKFKVVTIIFKTTFYTDVSTCDRIRQEAVQNT